MKPAVERVMNALQGAGADIEIREFAESTRTAEEAAAAIGTSVSQIVKSLVFLADGKPILVLVSGTNRVDTSKLRSEVGALITRADAETVRAATGFAIGGVPPIGHTSPLTTYLDRDLLQYPEVWAAAGTPNTVFRIVPSELAGLTRAHTLDLAAR